MEEQLIVCDEHGCDLTTASRTLVHEQGLWHRVIHIWIYDDEYLYVQQRAFTKKAFPGAYDITVAGHQNPHEAALDSAIRECREELGLLLEPDQLHFIGTCQEAFQHDCLWDKEIADVYVVNYNITQIQPNDEVNTLGKIPINEIQALCDHTERICHFIDIQTNSIICLSKKELCIHEEAYYQWILKEIHRMKHDSI